MLTPTGHQIELPGMRPQALALSPERNLLATGGKNHTLVLIDPADGRILQTVQLSTDKAMSRSETVTAQISFTGLIFSPDSRWIYLSNTGGNIWVFPVDPLRQAGKPKVFAVPDANVPNQKHEIPTGIAVSADGKRLYVAGNLGNRLHELEAESGKVLRSWDTGAAPFDVVLAGDKAYVSNLGGRGPRSSDLAAPAGKGTTVRVDPVRRIASEGSVTVIDLVGGKVKAEVLVGLHASALAVSPGGKYVVVANSGSDTLNVIDTGTDRIIEKIWARQTPADLFGAQPNALAFDSTGRRLYVCNGTQNAVAVIQFEPEDNASKVLGLIPVGWFPGAIQYDAGRKTLCVANMKGIGATKVFKPDEPVKLNTKDFFGTVSLVPVPTTQKLSVLTKRALRNMHYPKLAEARRPARPGQPARPVPERVGEPSVFKHVIYIIKENRSYDQLLGDMPEGNGDPALCIFGEPYTPNQHKIAREFVLLDNTYCAGVQSADGHQWTDSAIANEYTERQITSSTPRSYPGAKSEDGADALAWASSGFIWDNALAHGRTFRNYGEWMHSEAGWKDRKRDDRVAWLDFWREFQTGAGATQLKSRPAIESLRPHSNTNTVGWDLKVPDVMRAAEFIRELRQFETQGWFPNLVILFLPNDHTAGTRSRYPTPGAQVADNDLALGQVLEAVSHSRFWPETCLFAIEDDPQNGWDHVSGYRTACYVASPYTKLRQTISTQYNQTSLMRTIELILGLPPMNHLDATATPMTDCFTEEADLTPFTSVPNRVPLDQLNPELGQVSHPVLRQDALTSSRLPFDEVDRCPEGVFNQILWRAMKGPGAPYPAWAVKAVADDD
jgi:YVTN family beta-propeller protein